MRKLTTQIRQCYALSVVACCAHVSLLWMEVSRRRRRPPSWSTASAGSRATSSGSRCCRRSARGASRPDRRCDSMSCIGICPWNRQKCVCCGPAHVFALEGGLGAASLLRSEVLAKGNPTFGFRFGQVRKGEANAARAARATEGWDVSHLPAGGGRLFALQGAQARGRTRPPSARPHPLSGASHLTGWQLRMCVGNCGWGGAWPLRRKQPFHVLESFNFPREQSGREQAP